MNLRMVSCTAWREGGDGEDSTITFLGRCKEESRLNTLVAFGPNSLNFTLALPDINAPVPFVGVVINDTWSGVRGSFDFEGNVANLRIIVDPVFTYAELLETVRDVAGNCLNMLLDGALTVI